jgi:hypothetical protein
MPRNGSGGYQAPANSWNPAINGAAAQPADWQAVLDDVVAAIQGSLAADGQTPVTGPLNINNQRLTSVGAPTVAGDALRRQQISKGANIVSAATISIPAEGILFDVTGTTTITQINDSFTGRTVLLRFADAVTLTHSANIVLPNAANYTTAAGDFVSMTNSAPGVWTLVAPSAKAIKYDNTGTGLTATTVQAALSEIWEQATTTKRGTVELATDAEAEAMTDTDRALVPANLAAIFGGGDLGANGHFEIPVVISGARVLIIVNYGGVGVAAASGSNVTFDKEFPTAVLMSHATIRQSGGSSAAFAAGVGNETTSGMTVFNNGTGGTTPVAWFAVGY